MAFAHQESVLASGSSGLSGSVTLAGAPSDGELVIAFVHVDGTSNSISMSESDGGAAWTEFTGSPFEPSVGSHRIAAYWKIAASEPATYNFDFGTSDSWSGVVEVYSSAAAPEIDSAFNSATYSTNSTDLVCNAIDGAVISADSLSIVMVAKDRRNATSTPYDTVDNGYTVGAADSQNQATGTAHKISAGETFSGNVTLSLTGGDGRNYACSSFHVSFSEASGGSFQSAWAAQGNQIL